MYLSPSNSNKRCQEVAEVQRMMNAIRAHFHHNWEYLNEDGIYGKRTANAVRQFQIYRNIPSHMTPDGPVLGDTTIKYIRERYNQLPVIQNYGAPVQSKKERYLNKDVVSGAFLNVLQTFDSFIRGHIDYADSFRLKNPSCFKSQFISLAAQMDPHLQNLKEKMQEAFETKGKIRAENNDVARSNRKRFISDLKKFDIVGKIDKAVERFLSSKGIPTKFELGFLKSKPSIQFRAGGILQFLTYKDVVWDLLQVGEYGTEKWKADFKKDLNALLDGLIVGVISAVLGELLVAGGLMLAGVTLSAGVIAIIVAIVVTLLALGISWVMYKCDFSFAALATDAYYEIISKMIPNA